MKSLWITGTVLALLAAPASAQLLGGASGALGGAAGGALGGAGALPSTESLRGATRGSLRLAPATELVAPSLRRGRRGLQPHRL